MPFYNTFTPSGSRGNLGAAAVVQIAGGDPVPAGATLVSPPAVTADPPAAAPLTAYASKVASLTQLADNTFVDAFTVTVPNQIVGAAIRIFVTGTLGDGDSTDSKIYCIGISRIAGAAAKAVLSSAAAVGATAGATANAVVTAQVTSMTGATSGAQTFKIQLKVARSTGAAANHIAVAVAEVLNSSIVNLS